MKTYVGTRWPGSTKASWVDRAGRGRAGQGSLGPVRLLNSTFHTFSVVYFSYSVGYRPLRFICNAYSLTLNCSGSGEY